MPAWSEFNEGFLQAENQLEWLGEKFRRYFLEVASTLSGNVLLYFSAYMQSPRAENIGIRDEDINGVMNALHGMGFDEPLTVIMHTPGGSVGAVESITEYIHSKYKDQKVTAVIPVAAMSAGTMFALSCDEIIISKAGQLGPIDSHIPVRRRRYSVLDIIQQFKRIQEDPANPIWGPILESYSPALLQQVLKAEAYSKEMVERWLERKKLIIPKGEAKKQAIKKILRSLHDEPKAHSKRIGYEELKKLNLDVKLLEENQALQDAVMSIYHLATIRAENFPISKMIVGFPISKMTARNNLNFWEKKS